MRMRSGTLPWMGSRRSSRPTPRMGQAAIRPMGAAMADLVEHVAAIYQGTASDDVIKTGLLDLDERTGGMARGSLIVLAGRPAMGKTTVAAAIGCNAAREGHGVAFFSLQMPS